MNGQHHMVTVDELMRRIRTVLRGGPPEELQPTKERFEMRLQLIDWGPVAHATTNSERSAKVWTTTPEMQHYHGIVKVAAKIIGRIWLYFSQVITKPQERFNVAALQTSQALRDIIQSLDGNVHRIAARVEEMSQLESGLRTVTNRLTSISEIVEQLRRDQAALRGEIDLVRRDAEERFLKQEREIAELVHGADEGMRTVDSRLRSLSGMIGLLQHDQTMTREEVEALRKDVGGKFVSAEQKIGELNARMNEVLASREITERRLTKAESQLDRAADAMSGLSRLEPRVTSVQEKLLFVLAQVAGQERRIGTLLQEARERLPEPFDRPQLSRMSEELSRMDEEFYVRFEDKFRGTRLDIKERLRMYVPFILKADAGTADAPVLDLGCGRGEFLELLAEHRRFAEGVDTNHVMIEGCRAAGLHAHEGDGLQHLKSKRDGSAGAISAIHVIEHLPFDVWRQLIAESLRVLRPGGLLILETPNPENVIVGSNTFYYDPTHRNPLPPLLVKFIVESEGFADAEILHIHPSEEWNLIKEESEAARRMNDYFFGPRDYSIIARRPA